MVILMENQKWKILNFVAAPQRKSETTKFDYNFDYQRSIKIYVRHFSMLLYLKAFKKIVKNSFYFISNYFVSSLLPLMTPL